ncbi:MAG: pyruvate dehydrogenase complex dihydrolipoamide acetyltransferase [Woeseiaceae bacterium]|nr:pyruvate dehydrogenase complex dihydrolipoamide acetyltransferase [Woeseiaceae bacterium]
MPKEILLPSLAADFESGLIEQWHKKVGDKIDVGDVIADVSTDKAVVELEAEDEGTLGRILVPAGTDDVAVGTPIAILLLDGETATALEGFASGKENSEAPASGEAQPEMVRYEQSQPAEAGPADQDRVLASPVAVRIANQLGISLDTIEGSGPGGRVVLGDVEAAAGDKDLAPPPQPASAKRAVELPPPGTYTEESIDKVRRVIAQRLGQAKRDIPHFYLTIDCELDSLLNARQRLNESSAEAEKLSINDFIIQACAIALRDVPGANAGWTDSAILKFNEINIAVAVATERGLITPVIREADRKDLRTISSEIKALAERAQQGKLKPDEYKGGGFTVSNLGMYGIREFAAIINPPQSCILAVGAAERRAVVKDDELVVATMMTCTLSVDHRAVDGALGAEFLKALKSIIEEPDERLV